MGIQVIFIGLAYYFPLMGVCECQSWLEGCPYHPTPNNILTTSLILRQDKRQRHSTRAIVNINEALMKHF